MPSCYLPAACRELHHLGRHKKTIIDADGNDRRELGYYSTPLFIADFISNEMLRINPDGRKVLDPCVGKEELLQVFYGKGFSIDSFDLFRYKDHYVKSNFIQKDFLQFYRESLDKNLCGSRQIDYDYFIANPPYNCHEIDYIKNGKEALNALFPDTGCYNMYSMFIAAMIRSAKENALIGFITYDSFLTSRMHTGLRRLLIQECSIHHLLLCPADLFRNQGADIRTCIMILQKGKSSQRNVAMLNRLPDTTGFEKALHSGNFTRKDLSDILLSGKRDNCEFVVGVPDCVIALFNSPRIGDHFQCITGISTGNDVQYLRKTAAAGHTVPFYKNPGTRRFFTEPDGFLPDNFLEISDKIPNFIVRNKPVLMQEGIICSSMGVSFGACYRPAATTFGVNAGIHCTKKDLWWLLAYLNSSLVLYFVRGILNRTNMITSGYVARIPLVNLSDSAKTAIGKIANDAWKKRVHNGEGVFYRKKIDAILFRELPLPETDSAYIKNFCSDITRLT